MIKWDKGIAVFQPLHARDVSKITDGSDFEHFCSTVIASYKGQTTRFYLRTNLHQLLDRISEYMTTF